jgi:AcrR family transcriptional regulator
VSSQLSIEPGRRALNPRQAETVDRLLKAALEEVRAVGYDAFTVRSVAARADVAPATAYTYFASKNHLIAELFARQLLGLPTLAPADAGPLDRLSREFEHLASFLGREPQLASATTVAMLGSEPDVARLRIHTGTAIAERMRSTLGPEATDELVEALSLVWSGSLLQAGLGHQTYPEMAAQLTRVAALLVGPR